MPSASGILCRQPSACSRETSELARHAVRFECITSNQRAPRRRSVATRQGPHGGGRLRSLLHVARCVTLPRSRGCLARRAGFRYVFMNVAQKSAVTVPIPEVRNRPAGLRGRWAFPALVAAVVVSLPAASYMARARLLTGLAYLLTVDTVGPSADYIVPLGGGAETRPFEAAALYRRKVAPQILIFEYATNDVIRMGLAPSGTELYRRILELEGVSPSAIRVVPGAVDATWDEALAVRRFLPPKQPARLVVVTSPEHTLRARWTFQKAFAGTSIDVRMAPARNLRFDETNWWRYDEGVLTYLHEYMKLPFYWARYAF